MQRVFTEAVGNYRRGDCPERPAWWWERHKEVSQPLPVVIEAGLAAMGRKRQPRKTG